MTLRASAPLNSVLEQVKRVHPVDPTQIYDLLGARWYARGLYTKERKSGLEIKATRLFRVEEGDFVYNRLFAWKGSFALATADNDGCFVSNEFPCFRVDTERVNPRFLLWYFSRERAWAEAFGLSHGATPNSRNRLKEDDLLQMRVHLPALEEQNRRVEKIDSIDKRIAHVRALREQVGVDVQALLLARWASIVKGVRREPLEDVAPIVRRAVDVVLQKEYPELGIRSFGKGIFHKPALAGTEVGTKRLFTIRAGDLLPGVNYLFPSATITLPHRLSVVGFRALSWVPP